MLNDLSAVYSATLNECAKIPKTGLRLSDQFVVAYTNYINSTASVPGGYVAVEFDVGSAVLTSAPTGNSDSVITCVSAYGFAIAHCLTPLMKELTVYKSLVDQIFSGRSKADTEALLKEVRKIPASPTAMAQLENLLQTLPADEQVLVKKFVTDYSWWHGQKGIERDDFMYSPMLSCSKLVAASNGAIPTITKHFSAAASLYSAFKFSIAQKCTVMNNQMSQLITYGAPGTGKSHNIDECTNESNSIRVTFHPDTDYAAFVGAYKPTMVGHRKQVILDYENLVDKFKEYLSVPPTNVTRACALFGYDYHDSIRDMIDHGHTIPELVNDAYKSGSTYDSVVRAGMSVYEQSPSETESISYSFVPQAFMKAYVEAWKRYTDAGLQDDAKTYYLVIEEINRGNCAQIFGDLFQLLDRADNGFSAYAIAPDDDIQKFLEADKDYKLADIPLTEDIKKTTEDGEKVIATAADIKTGKKLVLPPNLYIWATMNTSDQSLFPIDSAFKRRWDWEYVPISEPEVAQKRKIVCAWDNGGVHVVKRFDWWTFLDQFINKEILETTKSEDKQLGYFFVKAPDETGEITAAKFASKVLFYLYNDVFKDYNYPASVFERKGGNKEKFKFRDFFDAKGKVKDEVVAEFLENLGLVADAPDADRTSDEETPAVHDEE